MAICANLWRRTLPDDHLHYRNPHPAGTSAAHLAYCDTACLGGNRIDSCSVACCQRGSCAGGCSHTCRCAVTRLASTAEDASRLSRMRFLSDVARIGDAWSANDVIAEFSASLAQAAQCNVQMRGRPKPASAMARRAVSCALAPASKGFHAGDRRPVCKPSWACTTRGVASDASL